MDKDKGLGTAQQQLKIINLKLQSKNLTDEDVSTLKNIVKNVPQLAKEVWETSKKLISKENDCQNVLYPLHTTSCLYVICCHIAEGEPKLAPEVFETFRTRLKSHKNNDVTIVSAYKSLGDIAHIPELRAEIFKTFRATVQSNENDMSTLDDACSILGSAMKDNPSLELASEIRTTAETILQSDKLEYRRDYHGDPKYKANNLLFSCRDYVAEQKSLTFEEFFDGLNVGANKQSSEFIVSEAKKVYETFKTAEAIGEFYKAYLKDADGQEKKCDLQYAEHTVDSFYITCTNAATYAEHVQKHSNKSSQKQVPTKDNGGR